MNYKIEVVLGFVVAAVGVALVMSDPTVTTINGADILAFLGCWLLWRGLVVDWPEPSPKTKFRKTTPDEVAASRASIKSALEDE